MGKRDYCKQQGSSKVKVIVTGGAGFIGSHVVDLLVAEGHSVLVLDNFCTGRRSNLSCVKDQIEIVECNIAEKGAWWNYFEKVDWVIHIAALADIVPSVRKPEIYFKSNVVGTFNVLEASKVAGIKRFIYTASSSCYGIPDIYPTPETAPVCPMYPYALTKLLGEQLVMHWARIYKIPANSVRLFNVYGPRSRSIGTYGAVFGIFLAQKLAGKPFTIVGDGTQTRDFTYVTDVARAIYSVLRSDKKGEIYNVGSGKRLSVNRIADLIEGERIFIPKRPGEPDCTWADISKIKTELRWDPLITINEGIGELLKNIDYWENAPVWDPDSIAEATKDWFKYLG